MRLCEVEGCRRKHAARGWCSKHWKRWRATGNPNKTLKSEPNRGLFIKVCIVDNCTKIPHGNKLCDAHYKAYQRSNCPEYEIWQYMKQRCLNKNDPNYPNYGGRGIKICQKWINSFQSFYEDMGKRTTPKHQLDRVDVNGNYEPDNCRWATVTEQANNKRNNVFITAQGKNLTAAQWSREVGITAEAIRRRLRYGWTPEKILNLDRTI